MTAFDYSKTAATALRLLERFGQEVNLVIPTGSATDYDPATSSGTTAEKKEARKAALFDFDRINFGMTLADGSRIQMNDRRCLMAADGTAPTALCFVEVDGERFPIKDIKIVSPAGVPVLYDMLIRK
jgi:hypothetical protein